MYKYFEINTLVDRNMEYMKKLSEHEAASLLLRVSLRLAKESQGALDQCYLAPQRAVKMLASCVHVLWAM